MISIQAKRAIDVSGPLSASLAIIGVRPMANADKADKLLGMALRNAGINRAEVRILEIWPSYEATDFSDIRWAAARAELETMPSVRCVIALGPDTGEYVFGGKLPVAQRSERRHKEGFIGEWRGSVIPANRVISTQPEDYLSRILYTTPKLPAGCVIIPTFAPEAILRQMPWHPWLYMDVAKAARIIREGVPQTTYRTWYFNDAAALDTLASSGVDLIAVDTELDPQIVSITTEDEVHVFEYNAAFRPALAALLESNRILKIAHNWLHDYADLRLRKNIKVARPYFDTQGAAHNLNNALQKELSPHIATRYTEWPYHKWLTNQDPLVYCGMDGIVCFDAYWPQIGQLIKRKLYVPGEDLSVTEFDHKLLTPLMEMQAVGFKIDEATRADVELELKAALDTEDLALQQLVEPIVDAEISRFKKPHLFRVLRKCPCCGGGSKQAIHCEACSTNTICWIAETQSIDYKKTAAHHGFKTIKAYMESLPPCRTCNATGKVIKKLEFNPDSSDQLADVLYRGLKIRPRTFKGNETVKAAQLDPIRDKHPLVARFVEVSKLRADYDTVARLRAGSDGALHCVFDPFGTGSGRVAGKEGLLEVGTNPMNLPVKARRFIVPRPGYVFLYPDFSQIEARAVAVLSGDKNLIAAFTTPLNWPGHPKHGKIDSHTAVVQMMLAAGCEITRDQAKRLVYAVMYGARAQHLAVELNATAFRMGQTLRVDAKQVQFMIDTFYRAFPGIKVWQNKVADEVLNTRRLRCPFTGRERTWLGYNVEMRKRNEDYGGLKYEIKKQVWSYLPQNIGAWILGLGLIDLYYNTPHWGKLLTPLIHVHDALLMEAPADRADEAADIAMATLGRNAFGMNFPVEMKRGSNWLEASGG